MFFLKAGKSVPSIKNSRVFYRVSRNLCVCRAGGECWWPDGWDSRFPLPWPGLNPWSGNWDSSSHSRQHDPEKKRKRKRKKFVWAKIAFRILEQEKSPFLCLVLVIENEVAELKGGWFDGLSLACPVCMGKAEAGHMVQLTPMFLFVDF